MYAFDDASGQRRMDWFERNTGNQKGDAGWGSSINNPDRNSSEVTQDNYLYNTVVSTDPNSPSRPSDDTGGEPTNDKANERTSKGKSTKIVEKVNIGLQIVDYIGIGIGIKKTEMISNRLLISPMQRVNTNNIRGIASLSMTSKWLGIGGYAGAGLNTYLDFKAWNYGNGDLSGFRFGLNTVATGTSVGIGFMYGGPYGGAAGLLYTAGSMLYDGTIWGIDQLSIGITHFNTAISNGWVPGRIR